MIEIAEAQVLSQQMKKELVGKTISQVSFGNSPHRFAFFSTEEETYDLWLVGKKVEQVSSVGNYVLLELADCRLSFSEGLNFYWLSAGEKLPKKYQFSLTFSDGYILACSVSMYGAMMLQNEALPGNEYFQVAVEKPSPLSEDFNQAYFQKLVAETKLTISLKGFMGTEQRIPGLGNGSLHDIFFTAKLLPKRKLNTLSPEDITELYQSMKTVLAKMVTQGGRNMEKDFYGQPGGYQTILSSKTWKNPCPRCGNEIQKVSFLGGTVYYCEGCQK
ncbi:DNA-formamidopyrimidine glycosylase family protein [Enterococcus alishanensis]|uniref:Formamidopyrimidine-DNA glycosylase n=1 Tax=Enterococcus alishanensis TaxID=1303817 RepID=A0ABS6TGC4_9ENTE|nr:DNA-formamidopyrimidine glycosylase family protein [Enterococcus alishanensis]MBV7392012.1 hypothetical protein [Enterococcus alishanensis]